MKRLSDDALVATLDRLPTGVIIIDRRRKVQYANLAARRLLHPSPITVGSGLPETSAGRSVGELTDRLFRVGALREEEVHFGEHVLAVEGSVDRHEDLATIALDDVSGRSRRHRSEADFVVNASHEILSPIAAIAGAVQVLQDGAKDDPVARERFLGHIAAASERLASTATALLVLARAEAGLGAPRLELVHLRPLLEDVVSGKDGIHVTCHPKVGVLADADLLRQALAILVENARLHARGIVDITVDETGKTVDMNIVDHGSGILPENLERVTERFVTGDGRSDGYGVGLSIAARAAKVLGGTLDLASGREGTRARLRLPSARLL